MCVCVCVCGSLQEAVQKFFEPVVIDIKCDDCKTQQTKLCNTAVNLPRLVCQVCVYSSQIIHLTTKRLKDEQEK